MKLRSALAIVSGVAFTIVITLGIDYTLQRGGVFPREGSALDDRQCLIATSYRVVIGVAAGWLSARLAPQNPMRHAMILGYLGTVLGLIGLVITWNMGLGPHWYPIALAVLAIPQSWLGGRIYEMRSALRAGA